MSDVVAISPEAVLNHQQEKKRPRPNDMESPVRTFESRNPSPTSIVGTPSVAGKQQQQEKQPPNVVPMPEHHAHHETFRHHQEYRQPAFLSPSFHTSRAPHYVVAHSRGHAGILFSSPICGKPLFATPTASSMPPPPQPSSNHYYESRASSPPPQKSYSHSMLLHGSSYENVTQTSGLPKALSFRKICSKCGKTRAEHGDCGFGNKCQFQVCGKCSASWEAHTDANSPMGVLCRLTVEEGATPHAAESYDRKIRELAERAELEKSLQVVRRERGIGPFPLLERQGVASGVTSPNVDVPATLPLEEKTSTSADELALATC